MTKLRNEDPRIQFIWTLNQGYQEFKTKYLGDDYSLIEKTLSQTLITIDAAIA